MKRYGEHPPWKGFSSSGVYWKRGGELWEGGYEWILTDNPPWYVRVLMNLKNPDISKKVEWLEDVLMPRISNQRLK